jgi:predicted dehydrogenase
MMTFMSKASVVRWGILSTGWIADRFAEDLKRLPGHELAAVGSRAAETAQTFAGKFGIPRAYASYEALVSDPDVDVVYVASPHPWHHPHTLLALNAGKHVLVEKPFAMDAREASEMIALARRKGLFLLEAMWTRFLPHIAALREVFTSGVLGRITSVQADHGQWFEPNPRHRLFAKDLGGGALLDLGIYPVSFASLVLGTPARITAVSDPAMTGVDGQTSMLFQYGSGAHAVLTTAAVSATPTRAAVVGTEARVEIDRMFFTPSSFTVTHRDGRVLQRYENTYQGNGLREQAAELGRCLAAGLTESPLLPLDETLSIMKTLDEVRKQIGLTY